MKDFRSLQKTVINIVNKQNFLVDSKLKEICVLLHHEVSYYDWVGFYFADHENQTLHLKAFSGADTEHTEISFGKGICGQVAISSQNFIVKNVREQKNYIACSPSVRSEIVIPIFVNNINIGQIDIDSHTINAFSRKDESFLTFVCEQVSTLIS